MNSKKKIIIDLDVITVSIWDKEGEQVEIAKKFVERVKSQEFHVVNPFFLIERVLKWKYDALKEEIKEFYVNYSNKLLSDTEINNQTNIKKIAPNEILPEIMKIGIKDEDAFLAFVGSLFNIEYLVTFNRKHLKNNTQKINTVLRRYNLNEIKIVLPDEI